MDDDFSFLNSKMHPLEGGKMEEFLDLMISDILPEHFKTTKSTDDNEFDSALFEQMKNDNFDKSEYGLCAKFF